jgi:hypothetical protein
MKKLVMVLLAVAAALSLLGWKYRIWSPSSAAPLAGEQDTLAAPGVPPEKHAPVASAAPREKHARAAPSAEEDKDREPAYLRLPVWYALKEEGAKTARVGYWDAGKKDFHAWKEVVVAVAEIPGISAPSGVVLLDLAKIHVIAIDPPIYYLQQADESFAPGHYSSWSGGVFYDWKDVRIKPSQIPDTVSKKRLLKKADVLAVRTITAPAHRLRESKTWKKD